MLFGYIVVVPLTAMLFGDEEDVAEHWPGADDSDSTERSDRESESRTTSESGDTSDALESLRDRYARGDLTDEQFERKLDRLLETETVENAADYRRRAADGDAGSVGVGDADRDGDSDSGTDTDRDGDDHRERERS